MAKTPGLQKDDPTVGGTSTADFVKAMLAAVVIGLGGGAAFGYFVAPVGPASPAKDATEQAEPRTASAGRFPNDALEIQIPPIIVGLDGEPKTQVRLDLSIIAAHGTAEAGALKNEIQEDVIAFLKGLTVADIQGVRGFQNLREQLDDRARIRGRGAVLGLLIGGLILE
jgi:flagellar protein FliL